MSANLYSVFCSRFPADLAQPAILHRDGSQLSYADLDTESAKISNLLMTIGVQPGDRVAAQVEKSITALLLYIACLRAGAIYLPLNTAYTGDELNYFLSDAQPTVFVCDPGRVDGLNSLSSKTSVPNTLTLDRDGSGTLTQQSIAMSGKFETVEREPDDLAALLYSSGTTGQPKGAMLNHGALTANAEALRTVWNFEPSDILLHTLPIFHTHGLFVATNTVLMSGARMIFHPQFDPALVLQDLPKATVFMGVPTYYTRLLKLEQFTDELCQNIRLFISGSAPLQDEAFKAFTERTGKTIVERYGMTEAGIITSAEIDKSRSAGTVGSPLNGVDLRVADDDDNPMAVGATGGVQIKSTSLFSGYWNMPEKTAEDVTTDGYFRTGDIGRIEPDGQLTLVGRAKDMFISGGFNVYPKEIEQTVDAFDGVEECAVIGLPHPDFGEAGLALVVPEHACDLDTSALRTELKSSLANYKVPKLIITIEALPRNAMGKVQKTVLRDQFLDQWNIALQGR